MTSPPTSPSAGPLQRLKSEEHEVKPRSNSFGDARWRTSSFSEPSRVVLIAVDHSPNSKHAFDFYVENIHRPDDLLVITHIPEPPSLPGFFKFRGGFNLPEKSWVEVMGEANKKVEELNNDYETECLRKKLRYKVRGESDKHSGQAICHIADHEHADMIIMGTRGQGLVKKAVLGSVSDYVARHADRPVLVVPLTKK